MLTQGVQHIPSPKLQGLFQGHRLRLQGSRWVIAGMWVRPLLNNIRQS